MRQMISSILLSGFSLWAYAVVDVQITPSTVHLDDSLQLTLTQDGSQGQGVPDLRVLQKDFRLLGTARQVNYAVINGQSTMSNQWVITLKPLKSGVLSIPAIKIGKDQSNPITINVEDSDTVSTVDKSFPADTSQALLLTTALDVTKPYVNQEMIYTVTLYNSKRLLDASYDAPVVNDALVIPLGDTKRYQTVKNSVSYVVEEQKYAIFPQKSGELTIHAPSFTALVYDFDMQRIKVTDKDRTISVLPAPSTSAKGSWLPAKNIALDEQYENLSQTLSQGSTLVRTIRLQGTGIPAQLLPSLAFKDMDGVAVYPEKGKDNNQIHQGELYGSTEFKVTYLFNQSGEVILPEVSIPWFNTQTGKEERAILPPRSLSIKPSMTDRQSNKLASSSTPADAKAPLNVPLETSAQVPTWQNSFQSSWWAGLALFFACAWLITLCLWGWNRTRRRGNAGQNRALKRLRQACNKSNPQQAREALLIWAAARWPEATVRNLADIMLLIRDPQIKKQLQALSQVLYQGNTVNWQGDALYELIKKLPKNVDKPKKSNPNLPGLNP